MKTKKTILNNINKDLNLTGDDAQHFFNCAKEYIKAVKENRLICNIEHVSKSGMSRYLTFKYLQRNKYNRKYMLLNTYFIFKSLGYRYNKNHCAFYIGGCGMDMVFDTNYNIIHDLYRLGFLSDKDKDTLAQNTPTII